MSTEIVHAKVTGEYMDMSDEVLVERLTAAISGDVDASARRKAEYSTDASNYRIPPRVVVFPKKHDDVVAALRISRELNVPLTSRGAGTSCAGNAVGPGMVLDFSRYMNAIVEIDPQARTARVQPGVVMGDLQKAAAPFGLRFGPDPSTQNRATFGGMIGNNACGPRAVCGNRVPHSKNRRPGEKGRHHFHTGWRAGVVAAGWHVARPDCRGAFRSQRHEMRRRRPAPGR